ncbi:MAG: NUDIX domain-containing protein [Candidatus Accumulibacter sp.]|jgi:ADP-ribose pyrophosphatase YjhB (NUDIX family)|nr:NUDIX domain-containing protein [Accumulibacter sp.]
MTARQGIPTGVHIVCERAGEILLLLRAGTGFFDGLYSLPGGHVEEGESIRQAAARELEEETGLRVAIGDLEWLGVIHRRSDTNRIDFFVRARRWQGDPAPREPEKCAALAWRPRARLPENTAPYIRAILDAAPTPGETGWIRELGFSGD